jgi:hypothetical protein
MIALCPYCHEVKHIGNANVRGRGEHARAWLGQINQWNEHQLDLYLAYVFEVWEERSLHEWELDIVELAAYGIAVGTLPADLPPDAVRFDALAEPPAIGEAIAHPELGVLICEQIAAIDRSHTPPISTVIAALADDSTWKWVLVKLNAPRPGRNRRGRLDRTEPRRARHRPGNRAQSLERNAPR